MSEPTTSGESENVLSSIRRLVSDDRHTPARETATPAPGGDRLLLTPSQRVATAARPAAPAPSDPFPAGPSPADAFTAGPSPLGRPPLGPPSVGGPGTRIGSASPAIAAGGPGAGRGDETGERASGRRGGPAAAPAVAPGLAPGPAPGDGRGEPGDEDGPGADPGGEFITHGDAPPPAAAGSPAGFEGAVKDDLPPGLDLEMLREIVRDVLREELQGAMGERITRGVRKLVRAEVARNLATAKPG